MKIGDVFPLGRLIGKKGPLVLDQSAYTVIYFYPKDQTPGCAIEAAEFQRLKPAFDAAAIRIVGVSVDDENSHQEFCDKMGLTFELATDIKGALGAEFGILAGPLHLRQTYILDRDANVVLHYAAVKPTGHAQAILDDIAKIR